MASNVVCLLPVRNAAPDLPGFFASAERFADLVIALDDGSTDETAELLQSHPLVAKVITNPARGGYSGWDDARNRNRLLEQVAAFAPDWIISVDADERIPADDASAMRKFLETDAIPGIAYGFRCYSMVGDHEHAQINPIWVYRLFAYQPGQRFPNQALHFAPIPTSIPRRAFLRTTFRIQHLGGVSHERKVARYEKYRQADPDCRFWPDYSSLLKEPTAEELMSWPARTGDAGFIFIGESGETSERENGSENNPDVPQLSIVVVDDGSADRLNQSVGAIHHQGTVKNFEIIVVTPRPEAVENSQLVRIVQVAGKSSLSRKRNLGLREATGTNVLFIDVSTQLVTESLGFLCDAHREGYAVVTGSVIPTEVSVSFKLEVTQLFGVDATESTPGVLDRVPPWASYRRSLLVELGGFDESCGKGAGHLLALRLEALGYIPYSIGDPIVHFTPERHPDSLEVVRNATEIGKAITRFHLHQHVDQGQLLSTRSWTKDLDWRRFRNQRETVSGNIHDGVAGTTGDIASSLATFAGAAVELVRPRRNKVITLAGRPAGIALFVLHRLEGPPLLTLVRFNLSLSTLKLVVLPTGLRVQDAAGMPIDIHRTFEKLRDQKIDRFTVHDLIGRPFQIEIDDLIVVDEEKLPERLRMLLRRAAENDLATNMLRLLSLSSIAMILRSTSDGQGIVTSLDRSALILGLSRVRAIPPDRVHFLRVSVAGEQLDADSAEMVRSFLDAGSIVRPATQRNRLRQVEWA